MGLEKDGRNHVLRYHLIKNVLNILNEKFTLHGIRVAYMMLMMYRLEGKKEDSLTMQSIEMALLHDIGAYGTEEVKDMLRFETLTPMQHAVYGYFFLKNLSDFGECSEIILYHHLRYDEKYKYSSKCKKEYLDAALRIHLIDRVDVLLLNDKSESDIIKEIDTSSGQRFDEKDVALFIKTNEKYHIIKHLQEEDYEEELIKFYSKFPYDFQSIINILKILVYSTDFRSEQTVLHTISSAAISKKMGSLCHLSQQEQEELYFGALLHDIGKFCIPLHILESKGRLDAEEMLIMRKHVLYTEKIIHGFVPESIERIAIRHHERCNGKGYPNQLTAEELTISERIVAIADVFSALVEKRSYKNSLKKEDIIDIIKTMTKEGEFDEALVQIAMEHYDELLEEIRIHSKDTQVRYHNLKEEYRKMLMIEGETGLYSSENILPDFGRVV